jgi:predicted dehydrogenase
MSMALNERLRLGIIGCGWATANLHVPALRRISGYEIVALADVELERADQLGSRAGARYRFKDASELIAHPEVDAVAVCVPPADHAKLAIATIDAGKHVFIEKPLTVVVEEAERLAERAKRTDLTVLVGFNLRWHRLVRQAKAMLDAGRIGSIVLMRTIFTTALHHDESMAAWRRERSRGGGVIHDLAVHHFDLWRFLLSAEVEEISVSVRSERWEDEAAIISARMTNGTLVSSVFASGTSENHEVECYGQAGRLQVSCYRYDGLRCFSGKNSAPTAFLRQATAKAASWSRAVAAMKCGGEIFASYEAQWRHFLQCVRNGASVACSAEDGRRAVALAAAATESSLTGRPISLKP